MRNEYVTWLSQNGYRQRTQATQTTQLKRIEKAYGDLEKAYEDRSLAQIESELTYSAKDEAANKPNPSKIPVEGNLRGGLDHLRGALKRYGTFLSAVSGGTKSAAWPELIDMRKIFLEICPDFEDFTQMDGTYYNVERAYKDALIAKAAVALEEARASGAEEVGRRLLLLMRPKPQESNFIGWRTFKTLDDCEKVAQERVSSALGDMVLADIPIAAAVGRASAIIEPVLRSVQKGAVFGSVRSLVSCTAALARPDEAINIKTRHMQRAARSLLGRGIFSSSVLNEAEYADFLKLAHRVKNEMEAWGWQPRDLWDIQGFFWVATDETWKKDQLTPLAAEDDDDDDKILEKPMPAQIKHPLNTILYGPPGTGKTWMTAQLAVEICNGATSQSREETMKEYRRLQEAGRIQFTTFHQSIGYEEFVEGLRPQTGGDESGGSAGFRLEARDGIFRKICAVSEVARKRGSSKGKPHDLNNCNFYKMSLGRAWEEEHIYDAAMAGGYVVLGWGGDVDWTDPQYEDWYAVANRWRQQPGEENAAGNRGDISQLWRFRSMKVGDLVIVSQGNLRFRAVAQVTGSYQYSPGTDGGNHKRAVKWLMNLDESLPVETIYKGRFTQASCYPLSGDLVKREALQDLMGGSPATAGGEPEPFVLIVDEINRANVSKVLGELITLLEEDKRLGADNELTVTLPYSGDTFGVPNNLYLIGTMNTADRSIAPLDTALRRRFSFREMMPDTSVFGDLVVGDVPLGILLQSINLRLEWLIGRDHQIGHAYFTGIQNKDALDVVMRHKILPLLGEYFYDDWEKVRIALNDDGSFFLEKTSLVAPPMLNTEGRNRYLLRQGSFPIEGYRRAAGLA